MSVTYGTSGGSTATTSPYSATISPAASRGFLVVFVGWEYTSGATVTSVTYAGHTMSRAGLITDAVNTYRMERFWLNYTEDSGDLVVTMSTGTINFIVGWLAFAGAHLTNPQRDGSSNTGSDTTPTNSVSSSLNDWMGQAVAFSSSFDFTPGWTSGQNDRIGQLTIGTIRMRFSTCAGVAGTKVLDAGISATSRWVSEAMSVQPPAGGVLWRPSGISGGMRALLGGMQG